MADVLGICGSSRARSKSHALLAFIKNEFPDLHLSIYPDLAELPLFHADLEHEKFDSVVDFKEKVINSQAVIIVTPEYIHNIPATLKNAMEWCTNSGEFCEKKVLSIVYTPVTPRGKYAQKSLEFSLLALKSKTIGSLLLHHTDISFDCDGDLLVSKEMELLNETIEYFLSVE